MRRTGQLLLTLVVLVVLLSPLLALHDPSLSFRDRLFAPPMPPRVVDAAGNWRSPFVYPLRLENRLERLYVEDRSRPVPLVFFSKGTLVRMVDEADGPWLPLGADGAGRDVWSRLLHGGRLSLGIAVLSSLGALLVGAFVGGIAGFRGGLTDELLMRLAEFVLVLPALYVVLVLRSVLPLVLPPWAVFALMTGIFAGVGWPWVARGVRGIVAAERTRDYAVAATALGASPARVLVRHLLPASRGLLATQAILLVPSFIIAEATLSFVGLGFPDTLPSWGSMLHEAANVNVLTQFPWTLAPALAIVAVTLGVNLALDTTPRPPLS